MSVLDEILGVITGNTKDRDRENKLGMSQSIRDLLAERAAATKATQEQAVAKLLATKGNAGPSQAGIAQALQSASPAPMTPEPPAPNPMDILQGITQQNASGMGNPTLGATMNAGVSGRTPPMAMAGQAPQLPPPGGAAAPGAPGAPAAPPMPQAPQVSLPRTANAPLMDANLKPMQQEMQGSSDVLAKARQQAEDDDATSEKTFSMIAAKALQPTDEIRKQADEAINAKYPGKGGSAKRFLMDFLTILAGQNTAKFRKTQDLMNDREHYESLYKQALVERGQNMKYNQAITTASAKDSISRNKALADMANMSVKAHRNDALDDVQAGLAEARIESLKANATEQTIKAAQMQGTINKALIEGTLEKDPVGRIAMALASTEYLEKYGRGFNSNVASNDEVLAWKKMVEAKFPEANKFYAERNKNRGSNGRVSVRVMNNAPVADDQGNVVPTVWMSDGRGGMPTVMPVTQVPGMENWVASDAKTNEQRSKALLGITMYGDMSNAIAQRLMVDPDPPEFGKINGSRLADWVYESGWFQGEKDPNATEEAIIRQVIDKYAQQYVYDISGKQTNQVEVEAIKSFMANRQKNADISLRFALMSKLMSEQKMALVNRQITPVEITRANFFPAIREAVEAMENQIKTNREQGKVIPFVPITFKQIMMAIREKEGKK